MFGHGVDRPHLEAWLQASHWPFSAPMHADLLLMHGSYHHCLVGVSFTLGMRETETQKFKGLAQGHRVSGLELKFKSACLGSQKPEHAQ